MKKMPRVCYGIAFFLCILCFFFIFSQRQENRGAGTGLTDSSGYTAITQAAHTEQSAGFQKEEVFSRLCFGKYKGEETLFQRLLPLSVLLLSCALVFLLSGETKASIYAFFRRSFLLNKSPIERIFIVQYQDGKKKVSLFL